MNKTILVIGEVTRDQYQEARIELLHKRHAPKVLRANASEFFLTSGDLAEKYGDLSGMDLQLAHLRDAEYPDSEYEQYANVHLAQFGNIGAIVVDEAWWNEWAISGARYSLLISMLAESDDPPSRWIAYPDGGAEYAGVL